MDDNPQTFDQTSAFERLRVTFATERSLAYVSVLELGMVWERSLRRAWVPLKYSQGFNPRPRMQFAAPLPVGCGGEAELLDVWLERPMAAGELRAALTANKLPADLKVVAVAGVPDGMPTLSEQVVEARYRIWLREADRDTVASRVAAFLATEAIPMVKRGRKHHGRSYDLRPLVLELAMEDAPSPWVGLSLRVSARPGATGRPDELLKALGFESTSRRCTRTALVLRPAEETASTGAVDPT